MQRQRLELAHEFVDGLAGAVDCSVLLSGPNGVGKSAVGLQAFLACFARRLPVVYIPAASEWVAAAATGEGDKYFLTELMLQNADLVAADPQLRVVLTPALHDGPLDSTLMTELRMALKQRNVPAVGVITDEVQLITKSLAAGRAPGAMDVHRVAATYFTQWENWACANKHFRRLDIASSHGLREVTLPSGEDSRLRIVRPWTRAVAEAAVSNPKSPLYIRTEEARNRLLFTCGGIPRSLLRGKERLAIMLSQEREPAALTSVVRELEVLFEESAQRWWKHLNASEQDAAASSMLALLRGELQWERVKGAYDEGVVARCGLGTEVTPVSAVAVSALVKLLAPHGRGTHKALSDCEAGATRGYELERQIINLLADVDKALPAKRLDGSDIAAVAAKANKALPFDSIEAVVNAPDNDPTLYLPRSKGFPCDAIIVPPSNNPNAPIVVWEASVTDPREPERVAKCISWFEPHGIIPLLRAAYPRRRIVCALCFPGAMLKKAKRSAYRELEKKAVAAQSVSFAVVAIEGLQKLGVLV